MNISHNQKLSSLVAVMVLIIVMWAARPAVAEQPLTIDVSPCVNIRSATERLSCYDEAGRPLTIDASSCVNIRSAIERLTCYDELVYQAQQTQSDPETADLSEPESDSGSNAPVTRTAPVKEQVPVTEQRVDEARRVTEEDFGLPPEKREDEKDVVELHSTIRELEKIRPSSYLITLENGQVWRQTVAERYTLKVGYVVRIWPARWSKKAFRLSAEGVKGSIQVERVH